MFEFLFFVGFLFPAIICIWGLAAIVIVNLYEWWEDQK